MHSLLIGGGHLGCTWVPVLGQFEESDGAIIFKGGVTKRDDGQLLYNVGNFLTNEVFGGGLISADITFLESVENEACGLILFYQPATQAFVSASIGGANLCSVRSWAGSRWITHASVGDKSYLKSGQVYQLKVVARGSRVTVNLDRVNVVIADLSFPLPRGQAGIWCMGTKDIRIASFAIERERPKVFAIMQFSPQYDELYKDVVVPICEELGLSVIRADETFGPGLIISDIVNQLIESTVVIAEITPSNPNVYYELGYAYGVRKPTILVAENATSLPFDVSPFRTLFYENTIGGKAKMETGLRKHLEAILTQWSAS